MRRINSVLNFRTLIAVALLLCGTNLVVEAQQASTVEALVNSISGGKLAVESRATPATVVGDFDGDKIADVAVIVELKDSVENVKKAVKTVNPYARTWGGKINENLLALFIIHGKGKGWKFGQKSSVLLLGRNSVLIFQKDRLSETGSGMNVEKGRNGKSSIVFPTEASEGILKWDGKNYAWTETEP